MTDSILAILGVVPIVLIFILMAGFQKDAFL